MSEALWRFRHRACYARLLGTATAKTQAPRSDFWRWASSSGHAGVMTRYTPDLQPRQDWMRLQSPDVLVRFPVKNLVARRTFIFAQSGFGKSNLVKLLFSELYSQRRRPSRSAAGAPNPSARSSSTATANTSGPTTRGDQACVMSPTSKTILWCSLTAKRLRGFTAVSSRARLSWTFVGSLRRWSSARRCPPERQDQQNVRKLKGLSFRDWKRLVDIVYQERLNADLQEVSALMGLDRDSGGMGLVEANAARSNMHTIVQMLHDPNSRLLDQLEQALRDGKLCVVDLSRMSGETARIMAGILLDHLFHAQPGRVCQARRTHHSDYRRAGGSPERAGARRGYRPCPLRPLGQRGTQVRLRCRHDYPAAMAVFPKSC
jgi:hypothetical protein